LIRYKSADFIYKDNVFYNGFKIEPALSVGTLNGPAVQPLNRICERADQERQHRLSHGSTIARPALFAGGGNAGITVKFWRLF
jgi:hypothetical protein